MKPFCLAALCLATHLALADDPSPATTAPAAPTKIAGIENAFRVTDKIYSGGQPEGEASFMALTNLGVKTIISVDGSMPDVETARKFGLRYIHLPIGYDGVPTNRVIELAKVATAETGPFFVHCHHGLHRGPAAVAIMCEADDGWTPARAEAWLKEAGTSADYPGLYRSARDFKAPTAAQLAAVGKLPELTKPDSLIEAMVAIDAHFDWLKLSQKAGWKTPPGHADISPAHEATMLWEQFKEIARTEDTAKRPADFRDKLRDAHHAAEGLRIYLAKPEDNTALDNATLDAALKQVTQSCAACHKSYRNK